MTDRDDHDVNWVLIAQAECVVAGRYGLSPDEAMCVLQFEAGLFGRSLTEIAGVVMANQGHGEDARPDHHRKITDVDPIERTGRRRPPGQRCTGVGPHDTVGG